MCHVQLDMLWVPSKKRLIMWAQHSPSPSCRDGSCSQTCCLSHSRCGYLAINSSAEIIKHGSNSLVDERPPSIGQQKKCYRTKMRVKKVLEKLTENLSGITTFFDPSGKLSMMCKIPVSITIFDNH